MGQRLDILAGSPLFQGIARGELASMLECLQPKTGVYEKDAYIGLAGEPFPGIGILLSGKAAVIKENAAGNRIILTLLGVGELMGEMAAFADERVWPATVRAQESSQVMFLPPEKIVGECGKCCTGHRALIVNLLRIITNKALMLNRKVEYFAVKSLRGKLCTYLLERYKQTGKTTFMLPMNRNELADFLNVSRPSLSREMCRMRDEGIIEFHRSTIKIMELAALKQGAQ